MTSDIRPVLVLVLFVAKKSFRSKTIVVSISGCVRDAKDGDEEQQGQGHLREGQDRRPADEGGAHDHREEPGESLFAKMFSKFCSLPSQMIVLAKL